MKLDHPSASATLERDREGTRALLAVATLDSGLPLDELVASLVRDEGLQGAVAAEPTLLIQLANRAEPVIRRAFVDRDPKALATVHRSLYQLYEQNVAMPGAATVTNQFNIALLHLRQQIERAWELSEFVRIPLGPRDIPSDTGGLVHLLERRVEDHPVASGRLYSFLETTASRDQIVRFFQSDYALNVRFFDLIALALLGTTGEPKLEMMRNMWDEAGRGDRSWVHTDLFRRVLRYVNVPEASDHFTDDWGWQAFAGFNLYYLMGLNRRNFYRYLGNMAATEILDPSLYAKLLRGCERIGLDDSEQLAYYVDHLTTDVAHGQGWLNNVIAPYVETNPGAAYDVYVGLEMRLNSCGDYHDYLYARLTASADQGVATG